MKYVLDSDTIIYFLKGDQNILKRLMVLPPDRIGTTIINHAELLYGAFNSQQKQKNLSKIKLFLEQITIYPFCKQSSFIFAEQKAHLKKQDKLIEDLDLMIASICIANQQVLVSNNIKHFTRINSLEVENWYAC